MVHLCNWIEECWSGIWDEVRFWITGARAASEHLPLFFVDVGRREFQEVRKGTEAQAVSVDQVTMRHREEACINNLHYEMSNFPHLQADWCDCSFLKKVMGTGGVVEGWQGNNNRSNCWWSVASSAWSWFAVLIPSVSLVCNVCRWRTCRISEGSHVLVPPCQTSRRVR